MMKMKRFIAIFVAILLMATSLVACKKKKKDADKITITLIETGIGVEWIEQIRDDYFNETGIEVEVNSDPLLSDYLINAMALDGEVDDDIYMTGLTYEWINWVYNDRIVDLTSTFKQTYSDGSSMESRLPEALKDLGKVGEHRYVAQFTYAPTGIVYNNTLLQEMYSANKVSFNEFPTKWDDLVKLAKEVSNANYTYKGNKVKGMVWGDSEYDLMDTFKTLWAQMDYEKYQAYFAQEDNLDINLFVNDERRIALEAMYDLIDPIPGGGSTTSVPQMISADHDDCYLSFLNGTALMCFSGAWFETEMVDYIDDSTFEYCFAPIPAIGDNEINVNINYPTEGFFIPSCSDNIEGAKDFLRFMFREDNIIKIHNHIQTPLATTYDASKLTLTRWGREVQDLLSYKHTVSGASSLFYHVAGLRPELEGSPFQKIFSDQVKRENLSSLLTSDYGTKSGNWDSKCSLVRLYRQRLEERGIL